MKYVSTRGQGGALGFEEVLLAGLARDGGLFLPESWPQLDRGTIAGLAGKPYARAAQTVLAPFVGDAFTEQEFRRMLDEAYASFSHAATVPLVQTGPNDFLLELFHGPTLAFKDVAMQLLSRMMDHVLTRGNRRITIVGATSGDTGASAIEAFKGREAVDIFILHPHGRVSDMQRRQMTSVDDPNVHNIALEGTFDDCQAIVKGLFNDLDYRDRLSLAGINSINWARVMAQAVYYATAAANLGAPHRRVAFSVPTGNFGDVYAGRVAQHMGVPVERLIVATNINDILSRTLATGQYRPQGVSPTQSPSMDIQVASNFERLLFELSNRDGKRIAEMMDGFAANGGLELDADMLSAAQACFLAYRADETQTTNTIRDIFNETGATIDPHTAVGISAARQAREAGAMEDDVAIVSLATAHPAKFPDAVEQATGRPPEIPAHLQALLGRPERCDVLPNDPALVAGFIEQRARAARAGA